MFLFQEIKTKDNNFQTKDKVEKTVSSVDFTQMKTTTWGMFDHLNFNVVSGKVTNGMNLEDYKEKLLAFYSSAKESGNVEELAFCYRAFKWLNTTELGSKSCSKQTAEIEKMDVSNSSEFTNKSGYYSKYFEVLARAVVGGTEDGTNVLWYHLNEKATEKLAEYLQQISKKGAMRKRGLFSFYTSENADIFTDQILKKFGGASFDYEIKNENGKWNVYFKGKEDASKIADPLRDSPGEFFSTRDMTMESGDSDRNRTRTNEAITSIVEGKSIQTGENVALSFAQNKEKGEVLTATNQEIASIWAHTPMFHAHHYKPIKNPEKVTDWIMLYLQGRLGEANPKGQDEREILNSIESLGDSFKKMLSDLAVRDGFDANKTSLVEFLKTDAGRKFWAGLVQSVKDGTFINVTGATSEYIGSPSDAIRQLDEVAVGRSKLTMLFLNAMARYTNGELAKGPNFNGEQLKEIDESSVSLVPTVVLLVDPGNTSVLISKALDYYKRGGNRSAEDIAFVQKKLEEFYSPQTIAQNQHNFLVAIEDLSQTSSEAKGIWDRWNGKGYIKQDSENGLYSFNSKRIGSINTEISFNKRIKQPEQTFEKALYVCSTMYPLGGEFMDARYSAYNLIRNVSLTLNIDKTEVKDNQVKVTVSVQKQFENKNGKLEDKPFAGHIDQYLFTEDGTRIEGKETGRYEKDGKTFIDLAYTVAPGMKSTFVGNAFDEINSGMVKKGDLNAEEEAYSYWGPVIEGVEVSSKKGRTATVPFTWFLRYINESGEKVKDQSVAAHFAFGLRDNNGDIRYFSNPFRGDLKNNEYVQTWKMNKKEYQIALGRGLKYEGKDGKFELTPEQLVQLAKSGVALIQLEGIWFRLDGVREKIALPDNTEKSTEKVGSTTLTVYKPSDLTLSGNNSVLYNNKDDFNTVQANRIAKYPSAYDMQPACIIKSGDVKIGVDKDQNPVVYGFSERKKLADQGVIAIVGTKMVNGFKVEMVYDLNGAELGNFSSFAGDISPDVHGLFTYRAPESSLSGNLEVYFPKLDEVKSIKVYGVTELSIGAKEKRKKR